MYPIRPKEPVYKTFRSFRQECRAKKTNLQLKFRIVAYQQKEIQRNNVRILDELIDIPLYY